MAVEEKEYSPESERKTVLQRMRFAWKSRLPALARIALTAISLVGVHFIGRELYKTVKTSVAVEAATDSSEYVAWDGKDVGKLVGKNL